MKISKRLQKIAEMVKYPTLADIGTDHGHLPIYLAQTGRVIKILATDINPGSLGRAEENIGNAGLTDFFETRLCDGLDGVNSHEYGTCVISGMGGGLIIDILQQNLQIARGFRQILLSPQRNVACVRVFLHENGFCIDDEEMLEENEKFYNILDVVSGREMPYDEKGYIFGKKLIEKRHTVLIKFVLAEIFKTNSIISGLCGHNDRRIELERYLKHCNEVMKCL